MSTITKQTDKLIAEPLAIKGGPKAVPDGDKHEQLFHWPIVTEEDEQAVLDVLRAGTMSSGNIARQFEDEFADYLGMTIVDFREKYLTDGESQINMAKEPCPFQGADGKCTIHEVRPAACAKYPWMGAACDARWVAWAAERCPGLTDDGVYPMPEDIEGTPEWVMVDPERQQKRRDLRAKKIADIKARIERELAERDGQKN